MHPLIGQQPYAAIFWIVFALTFGPELLMISRTAGAGTAEEDRGSLRLIVAGKALAITAAFMLAANLPAARIGHPAAAFGIGLGAMLAGAALRRYCFRLLGASFTSRVGVQPGQTIVERGPYRWVRHPSYTAAALSACGVALALGNWLSLAVVVAVSTVIYPYRVRVEEAALVATLGEPYRAYMARTRRFVPFVV